jgi:hypothetical protein
MNYWITAHWPPRKTHQNTPDKIFPGIWLPDDRKSAGDKVRKGDLFFIYQAKSGRPEIRNLANGSEEIVNCFTGREGIIAVCECNSEVFKLPNIKETKYTDGTTINWCWHAEASLISRTGFIKRQDVNRVLQYKPNYNYRGFGDVHSGLKKLTKHEFESLLKLFNTNIIVPKIKPHKYSKNSFESIDHYLLKYYVAENPALVLKETGMKLKKVEYSFPTGDRADIILEDKYGRIIGLEIEVDVHDGEFEGILQAIKYRYMAEPLEGRKNKDSRAVLVAYSITTPMKDICKKYEVSYIEVTRQEVNNWAAKGIGLKWKQSYRKAAKPNYETINNN